MASKQDYYAVLGVDKKADEKQIKNAFRELALRFHPDRNKSPGAEEKFKEIAEAYAVLSDPKKRQQYDARGFSGVEGFSAEDLFGGINFEDIFRDFGVGIGGFDFGPSFFSRVFGGSFDENIFSRARSRNQRGADIEVKLQVPLSTIYSGGDEVFEIMSTESCSRCQGSGAEPGTQPKTCDQCHGTGSVTTSHEHRNIVIKKINTCAKCGGAGTIIENPCHDCQGRGQIQHPQKMSVKIPKGIEDGTIIQVAGRGALPESGHGPPGDLLVMVEAKKDSRFNRSGPHLWHSVSVPVYDAVLGTRIKIPLLQKTVDLHIPEGTQSQTTLVIQGEGLPRYNTSGYGDIYVVVTVEIPKNLNSKEKLLYKELKRISESDDKGLSL